MPVRIGLIGSGFIGRSHSIALSAVGSVFPEIEPPVLEVIAEADAERAVRAAHELGFRRSASDWRELVHDPDVDVVDATLDGSAQTVRFSGACQQIADCTFAVATQDNGEPGLSGVTVNLLDQYGGWLASKVTDEDGAYQFTGLAPGSYRLRFDAPQDYQFAPQDQGSDDTKDSDADATGTTAVFSLSFNEVRTDLDAGLFSTGSGGSGGGGAVDGAALPAGGRSRDLFNEVPGGVARVGRGAGEAASGAREPALQRGRAGAADRAGAVVLARHGRGGPARLS